jgi:mannose-1-phosphate guanylyltransferase/mannose-6-phosphate isomerase
VLALAADHVILDDELFHAACRVGRDAAQAGRIVTFGIPPFAPKTCYGYIRCGAPLGFDGCCAVEAFVEKPDAATAARYVSAGYLWNSGNFLFRADALLDELARFEPTMARAVEAAVEDAKIDLGFVRLDAEAFAAAPQKSIDYAVMEKTACAAVIEGRFRWSDIGSWEAVFDVGAHDEAGNVVSGPVATLDAQNCVIHAEDRLTVAVGVRDLIVVTTPDAALVLPRGRAEDVKNIVARLKREGRSEATEHRRLFRPWGHSDALDDGDRFQVKRIVVKPGAKLSLQRHFHRAEHWVVVRGTAEVTIGEATHMVHENESIFIPIGAVHRLANPGRIPLEVIEVQTGSYLGDDDIVRLDDIYKRV